MRAAKVNNGYWLLEVAQAGNYQIRLHRWPPHLKASFADQIPSGDSISGGNPFKPGVGLPIESAKIEIQERELTTTKSTDTYYAFDVALEEGPTRFQTWCTDDQGYLGCLFCGIRI